MKNKKNNPGGDGDQKRSSGRLRDRLTSKDPNELSASGNTGTLGVHLLVLYASIGILAVVCVFLLAQQQSGPGVPSDTFYFEDGFVSWKSHPGEAPYHIYQLRGELRVEFIKADALRVTHFEIPGVESTYIVPWHLVTQIGDKEIR